MPVNQQTTLTPTPGTEHLAETANVDRLRRCLDRCGTLALYPALRKDDPFLTTVLVLGELWDLSGPPLHGKFIPLAIVPDMPLGACLQPNLDAPGVVISPGPLNGAAFVVPNFLEGLSDA